MIAKGVVFHRPLKSDPNGTLTICSESNSEGTTASVAMSTSTKLTQFFFETSHALHAVRFDIAVPDREYIAPTRLPHNAYLSCCQPVEPDISDDPDDATFASIFVCCLLLELMPRPATNLVGGISTCTTFSGSAVEVARSIATGLNTPPKNHRK